MADKKPMVGWYDPRQIVPTAVRAAVSGVFGAFADRREAMAGARPLDPKALDPAHDYSARPGADGGADGLWIDFAADTGEGWDATYAIARLLAEPEIALKSAAGELALTRGRILVLGGDQVYPTASRTAYRTRFLAPFETAYRTQPEKWAAAETPDLYAIPGNHDWYDGLSAFLGVFCRRRLAGPWSAPREGQVIGGRCTQQTRSYFALKLPGNWWLCGVDIQLAGYIDQPQVDFFAHVATHWMGAGDTKADIILCTGRPEWLYASARFPESFRNLDYLEAVLTRPGHRLRLAIAGDMHNYNRYVDEIEEHATKIAGTIVPRQYVTCGGGGAFLHPTHALPKANAFAVAYAVRGETRSSERSFTRATKPDSSTAARYPSAATSWLLSLGDLFFAVQNLAYTGTLWVLFALYVWMLDAAARDRGATLGETLATPFGLDTGSDVVSPLVPALPRWLAWSGAPGESVLALLAAMVQRPAPVVLALAVVAGAIYFASCRTWPRRILLGTTHALLQLAAALAAIVLAARFWPWRTVAGVLGPDLAWLANPAFIAASSALAAVVAATLLGVYLLLCLSLFGIHWNEAFSALRIADYKSILRLHLAPDGTLRLYAIGLRAVPEDHGKTPRNRPLKPHLIEGPIVLPAGAAPTPQARAPVASPVETPPPPKPAPLASDAPVPPPAATPPAPSTAPAPPTEPT